MELDCYTRFTQLKKARDLLDAKFCKALADCVDAALACGQIKLHAEGYCLAYYATHVTICELIDADGTLVATGYSFCSQQYNRKLGNKIALGRARKALR